jgi:hypothetical protein
VEKLVTLLDLLRGSIIALGRAPLPSENTQAVFSTAVRATCIAVSAVVTSDMNRYYTGECRVATISHPALEIAVFKRFPPLFHLFHFVTPQDCC